MNSLNASVAAEHTADLLRAADDYRRAATDQPHVSITASTIALRLAAGDEAHVVRRLAALDNAPALSEGGVLLALVDGEAVAAISLADGRVVADPFVPTQEAVALLRLRANHLAGLRQRRRRRIMLRPRLA